MLNCCDSWQKESHLPFCVKFHFVFDCGFFHCFFLYYFYWGEKKHLSNFRYKTVSICRIRATKTFCIGTFRPACFLSCFPLLPVVHGEQYTGVRGGERNYSICYLLILRRYIAIHCWRVWEISKISVSIYNSSKVPRRSLEGVILRRGDIDFAIRRKSLFSQQRWGREAFLKQFCITSGAAKALLWRFFRGTGNTIKLVDPFHALKNEFSPSPGLTWWVSCYSSDNGRSACLSCPDTCSSSVLDLGCSENSFTCQEAESR